MPTCAQIADAELLDLQARRDKLEQDIRVHLIPKDAMDDRNVILEIRAGTGGDEASLFAGVLFRMYERYAAKQGWKTEVMSESPGSVGGFKEIVAEIRGRGAFSKLKFESGVHRVQRVPDTEASGRIHTSAATVAVLPEVEDVDVTIRDEDLKIDTLRASGAGGQHVNKTESAIRITHLPSGIVIAMQEDRSQHRNKAKAMAILRSRLYEHEREKRDAARSADRRDQIGSGDRSERIRTYNFPQGRVTDHRINLTLYKLPQVIEGRSAWRNHRRPRDREPGRPACGTDERTMTMAETLSPGLTVMQARRLLANLLREDGIESADLDARVLICGALAIDHTALAAQSNRLLSAHDAQALSVMATRRLNREPIARIIGHSEFWSLRFRLSADTLVPRPETETVVEAALDAIADRRNDALRIADLGTGSGAILLALLHELPNAFGVGTDRSADALMTARTNAADLQLSQRASFAACDFSSALRGAFDLVVSNPPYIETGYIDHLQLDVRDYDPILALDGGTDGLAAYRAIAADARRLLAPRGTLVVELGFGQLVDVCDIMANAGLAPKSPARADLAGIPRALILSVLS